MPEILVTDSLFIAAEHERRIAAAGYTVQRLDKARASEAELCAAVAGKVGYILGGVEQVTAPVVEAGDQLRAIVFTGADWRYYVPGFQTAHERGIAVANCPGANAVAVAEYTVTLMLAMTRNVFQLGRTGSVEFGTTRSLPDLRVGLVGLGAIGTLVAGHLRGLGVTDIRYFSRHRKLEVEDRLGLTYLPLAELAASCDVLSLHASKEIGAGYVDAELLGRMPADALLVDTSFVDAVDRDALYEALRAGSIRAALDQPVDDRFDDVPLDRFFHSRHTAYNTHSANRLASDMATTSLLNLLATGEDPHRVV